MKSAFVFLATGFEETEAIGTVDVLRRAGIQAATVSITGSKLVTGSHQVTIEADYLLEEAPLANAAALILPGGLPGATNLNACVPLKEALLQQYRDGGIVAAICAGPITFGKLGIVNGKNVTCYPGFEDELKGCNYKEELVVTDGNIITGRGPAAAVPFAFEILKHTKPEKVEEIKKGMLFNS
mgnify:CR=1 FL=1